MQDNLKRGNKSFDSLIELIHLGTILTNQYSSHEDVTSEMKSGNPCYHLVKNFCLPVCYRKTKIKIYSTIILPVVSHGYEIWSLTLREELKLRFSEHRALKKIFDPKGGRGNKRVQKTTRRFMPFTPHQILFS